jgi:hypothetical protein
VWDFRFERKAKAGGPGLAGINSSRPYNDRDFRFQIPDSRMGDFADIAKDSTFARAADADTAAKAACNCGRLWQG